MPRDPLLVVQSPVLSGGDPGERDLYPLCKESEGVAEVPFFSREVDVSVATKTRGQNALTRLKRFAPEYTFHSIRDAKTARRLNVDRRHCRKAERSNPTECAIAKCGRALPDVDLAVVGRSIVYLGWKGKVTRYRITPATNTSIRVFDAGGGFDLGEVSLLAPGRAHLLGAKQGSPQNGKGTNAKRQRRMRRVIRGLRPMV